MRLLRICDSQKTHGAFPDLFVLQLMAARTCLARNFHAANQETLFAVGSALVDHTAFKPRSMPCFARFAALCIPLMASATCLSTALH